MKKYIFLLFLAGLFTFSSCSSDDDAGAARTIVGTWVLVGIQPDFIDPAACDNDSVITFEEDNSAEGTFYFEENGCEATNDTGTWEKIDSNTYLMEVPQFGELEGDVTFVDENRFSFETIVTYAGFTSPAVFTFERQ